MHLSQAISIIYDVLLVKPTPKQVGLTDQDHDMFERALARYEQTEKEIYALSQRPPYDDPRCRPTYKPCGRKVLQRQAKDATSSKNVLDATQDVTFGALRARLSAGSNKQHDS